MEQWHYIDGLEPDVERVIAQLTPTVEDRLRESGMDGDCQTASEEWAKSLAEAGISGFLAVGHFENVPHYWLEIGGGLFDPTGGQFEELEGVSPSEGSYSVAHRSSFGKQKRKNGLRQAEPSAVSVSPRTFYEGNTPVVFRRDRYVLVLEGWVLHLFDEGRVGWVARKFAEGKQTRGLEFVRGASPREVAQRAVARWEAARLLRRDRYSGPDAEW